MTPEAVGLIVTAVSGGFASIIYAFKNIKKSECCGCECEQRVPNSPTELIKKPKDTVINIIDSSEL